MVVQHNISAMNANRMLGVTQGALSKSTEKLSSGYKINRAADNAAGLSISEKMRKQIRGLDQATANAEDGISSVQTAEGALQEVTDMLQRMNELAVQAANGTNSVTDRTYIQNEIDQLVTEVDRVAETTKFNETYLLKGDESKPTSKVYTANYATTFTINNGSNKGAAKVEHKVNYNGEKNLYIVSVSIAEVTSSSPLTANTIAKGDDITKYLKTATTGGTNGKVEDTRLDETKYVAFQNVELDASKLEYESSTGFITNKNNGKETFILDTETNSITRIQDGEDMSQYFENVEINGTDVDYANVKSQYRLLTEAKIGEQSTGKVDNNDYTGVNVTDAEFKTDESKKELFDADGKVVSGIALNKYLNEQGEYTGGLYDSAQATNEVSTDDINDYITKNTAEVTKDLSFSLHVGADSDRTNKISTSIQSMSAAALGINKLKSTSVGIVDETGDNATDAIDVIANALQQVSTQRSALGAIQNRLEHTIKNLDNVIENTTSAESAIRDTDMATEMVKYSASNIIAQAGQSMLAQANQSNQGVLSLIG